MDYCTGHLVPNLEGKLVQVACTRPALNGSCDECWQLERERILTGRWMDQWMDLERQELAQ